MLSVFMTTVAPKGCLKVNEKIPNFHGLVCFAAVSSRLVTLNIRCFHTQSPSAVQNIRYDLTRPQTYNEI